MDIFWNRVKYITFYIRFIFAARDISRDFHELHECQHFIRTLVSKSAVCLERKLRLLVPRKSHGCQVFIWVFVLKSPRSWPVLEDLRHLILKLLALLIAVCPVICRPAVENLWRKLSITLLDNELSTHLYCSCISF